MPENWVQHPVINTEEGTNPGAPLAWGSPENPDDVVAGYGYVAADTSEVEETFYYHSDHLGSTAYITDQNANVTQYDAYLPYGELLVDEHSSSADLPYKFNGKELDEETGLYYYGARYMNPITSMWYGVDQLAEKYNSNSGYLYCMSNPIRLVDKDGNKWFEYKDKNEKQKNWHWIDTKENFIMINGKKIKGHDFVVQFNGLFNERMGYYKGSKSKKAGNYSLSGEGAILADVTVYGPKGANDIEHYKGYTMSSDVIAFGIIADGDYSLDHLNPGEKPGPFGSLWTINGRGRVEGLGGFNPRHPKRSYLTGAFVHRSNNDGWAGTFVGKDGRLHGVSEGCLLIVPQQWDKFDRQLSNAKHGLLRLTRR